MLLCAKMFLNFALVGVLRVCHQCVRRFPGTVPRHREKRIYVNLINGVCLYIYTHNHKYTNTHAKTYIQEGR